MIEDSFEADVVDASTWNVLVNGIGADAVQRNGKLVVSIAPNAKPGGEWNFVGVNYGSRCRFAGDIDMQVSYRLVQWPLGVGVYVSLQAVFADGMVERFADDSGGDVYASWIRPRFATQNASGPTGVLRLVRKSGIVTTYYLLDGAWQQIDSAPAAEPAVLQFGLQANPGVSPSAPVSVEFDDFRATASGAAHC